MHRQRLLGHNRAVREGYYPGISVAFPRKFIRYAGWAACALAMAFLARAAMLHGADAARLIATPRMMLTIALAACLNAAVIAAVGWAWARMVSQLDRRSDLMASLLVAYGRSQLAKYLPGNIAHFAARHIRIGDPPPSHRSLALATLAEIGGLLTVAGLLLAGLSPYMSPVLLLQLPETLHFAVEFLAPAAVFAAVALVVAAPWLRLLPGLRFVAPLFHWARMLEICACYSLFFAVLGGISFAIHAATGTGPDWPLLPPLFATFVAAWLAGYVIPGAPGGLGVRESVFTLLLSPTMGEPTALAVALLLRVVTIAGDGLHTGLALLAGGWFANLSTKRAPVGTKG